MSPINIKGHHVIGQIARILEPGPAYQRVCALRGSRAEGGTGAAK
jgi:hypothetical protein